MEDIKVTPNRKVLAIMEIFARRMVTVLVSKFLIYHLQSVCYHGIEDVISLYVSSNIF